MHLSQRKNKAKGRFQKPSRRINFNLFVNRVLFINETSPPRFSGLRVVAQEIVIVIITLNSIETVRKQSLVEGQCRFVFLRSVSKATI